MLTADTVTYKVMCKYLVTRRMGSRNILYTFAKSRKLGEEFTVFFGYFSFLLSSLYYVVYRSISFLMIWKLKKKSPTEPLRSVRNTHVPAGFGVLYGIFRQLQELQPGSFVCNGLIYIKKKRPRRNTLNLIYKRQQLNIRFR